jgi:hypothetical protein
MEKEKQKRQIMKPVVAAVSKEKKKETFHYPPISLEIIRCAMKSIIHS